MQNYLEWTESFSREPFEKEDFQWLHNFSNYATVDDDYMTSRIWTLDGIMTHATTVKNAKKKGYKQEDDDEPVSRPTVITGL